MKINSKRAEFFFDLFCEKTVFETASGDEDLAVSDLCFFDCFSDLAGDVAGEGVEKIFRGKIFVFFADWKEMLFEPFAAERCWGRLLVMREVVQFFEKIGDAGSGSGEIAVWIEFEIRILFLGDQVEGKIAWGEIVTDAVGGDV